jgi:spore maturation protein A
MILIGVAWGAIHGTLGAVTNELLSSAGAAVDLCITMLGLLSFWTGILEIARNSGLLEQLTRLLRPLLRFLFPGVPPGHPAEAAISTNVVANLLGLGWAATPAGLEAMKELKSLHKGAASNDMCNFLILNMSSLQLIPINMIAYRSQYGSANPATILMPGLLATTASTLAGIAAAKLLERIWP